MTKLHLTRCVAVAFAALGIALPLAVQSAEPKEDDKIVLVSGEQSTKDHVTPHVFLSVDRLPAGGKAKIAVKLDVEPGWHINTNPAKPEFVVPTTVALKGKHGVKLGELKFPTGKDLMIEGSEEPQTVYEGEVFVFGTLTIPAEAARQTEELTVEVKFQACNEKQCLRPVTRKLTGKIAVAAPGETVKTINEKIFAKDSREKDKRLGSRS